ncbi:MULTISPECIES: hypothetical protein [unclassified Blastococcus]
MPGATAGTWMGATAQAELVAGQAQGELDWDDAHLINAAVDIHADDPAFG